MGLNHMNGRVEDAILGRFLSPDPHVTDPTNPQNYNRYSYVNNNPLTFSDPTGFAPKNLNTRANRTDGDDSEIDWTAELAMFRNAVNFQAGPDSMKPRALLKVESPGLPR